MMAAMTEEQIKKLSDEIDVFVDSLIEKQTGTWMDKAVDVSRALDMSNERLLDLITEYDR